MDAFELHAVLADGTFQFVEIGTGCAGNAYTDDNISTSSSSNASSDDDEDVELIMPICASRIVDQSPTDRWFVVHSIGSVTSRPTTLSERQGSNNAEPEERIILEHFDPQLSVPGIISDNSKFLGIQYINGKDGLRTEVGLVGLEDGQLPTSTQEIIWRRRVVDTMTLYPTYTLYPDFSDRVVLCVAPGNSNPLRLAPLGSDAQFVTEFLFDPAIVHEESSSV
eukprot:scpid80672/ scgid17745/ 